MLCTCIPPQSPLWRLCVLQIAVCTQVGAQRPPIAPSCPLHWCGLTAVTSNMTNCNQSRYTKNQWNPCTAPRWSGAPGKPRWHVEPSYSGCAGRFKLSYCAWSREVRFHCGFQVVHRQVARCSASSDHCALRGLLQPTTANSPDVAVATARPLCSVAQPPPTVVLPAGGHGLFHLHGPTLESLAQP